VADLTVHASPAFLIFMHHPEPSPATSTPRHQDPFPDARPYRLIGVAEREQYHPLLTAIIGGVAAFAIFQGVVLATVLTLIVAEARRAGETVGLEDLLAASPDLFFGANALGQIVGLGAWTVLLVRFHTPDVAAYVRLRRPDPGMLGMSALGLFAVLPFVSWVGEFAKRLPYPDFMRQWDADQAAMLEVIFQGQANVVLALLFVAVTPALCEELLFRGFIQRNVERWIGPVGGILLVGLAFGLFHLRFVELIPLTLLGIYMCYVVWVSGSLWTGILVHFLNNGFAILASDYAARRPEPVALDEISVPWYLAMFGLLVVISIVAAMQRRREMLVRGTPDLPSP
jgi:uncharacterized protein